MVEELTEEQVAVDGVWGFTQEELNPKGQSGECVQLPPKQSCYSFKKAFNMFDKDKQGFIMTRQVGSLLRTMGQAFEDKDLRELIAEVDTDGSGQIEFDEFLTLVARFVVEGDKAKMEQELREAFRLYDKQGNGYINVSDLREILRALDDNITEEELDEMIAEIDTDGSGTVDFDEFMEMMTAG